MARAEVMDEVMQKLVALNYPRAAVPAQSLLYAGLERYTLLEWLFFKLLGEKSAFGEAGAEAGEEEVGRIQYLAEIAKFLGLTQGLDTEAIQGKGSYESRAESLHAVVELVEASFFADNSEWSGEEQVVKDVQLVDAIADRQAQVFSDECKLFPADVPVSCALQVPAAAEIGAKLGEQLRAVAQVEQMLAAMAAKRSYDPNQDPSQAEAELRKQLQTFLDTARAFDAIYSKEIRPWTHMMEVAQLHGLGPAAKHVLESYRRLLSLLRSLKSHRDSHSSIAQADATSSLGKLVRECEDALLDLNHGLSVLSEAGSR